MYLPPNINLQKQSFLILDWIYSCFIYFSFPPKRCFHIFASGNKKERAKNQMVVKTDINNSL